MTEEVPVQVLADPSKIARQVHATQTPSGRAAELMVTGEDGRCQMAPADVNHASSLTVHGGAIVPTFNIEGDTDYALAVQSHNANLPASIIGARAQGSQATPSIVVSDDALRTDYALGYDGVDWEIGGYTSFLVDGTPAADQMPTRWTLFLTPAASFTPELCLKVAADKTATFYGSIVPVETQRMVACLTEVVTAASLTAAGAAVGTKVLTGSIPKGAWIIGADVTVQAGFAGDVSATITIGDGSDDDRYNTGTPSVFATAADGIAIGIPSGAVNVLAANSPTVTITSAADITPVLAGGGSLTIRIYYIPRS